MREAPEQLSRIDDRLQETKTLIEQRSA